MVWHDLLTPNPAGAREFYGELLGWTFEDVGSGYTLARHEGRLVAGIAKVDKGCQLPTRRVFYLPLNIYDNGRTGQRLTGRVGSRKEINLTAQGGQRNTVRFRPL